MKEDGAIDGTEEPKDEDARAMMRSAGGKVYGLDADAPDALVEQVREQFKKQQAQFRVAGMRENEINDIIRETEESLKKGYDHEQFKWAGERGDKIRQAVEFRFAASSRGGVDGEHVRPEPGMAEGGVRIVRRLYDLARSSKAFGRSLEEDEYHDDLTARYEIALQQFAENRGAWHEDVEGDLFKKGYGNGEGGKGYWKKGGESRVYIAGTDSDHVIKTIDGTMYQGDVRRLMERIVGQNLLSKGGSNEIIGYGRREDGKFVIVTKQKMLPEGTPKLKREDIEKTLMGMNLRPVGESVHIGGFGRTWITQDNKWLYNDFKNDNIYRLKDDKGNNYAVCIDCAAFVNTPELRARVGLSDKYAPKGEEGLSAKFKRSAFDIERGKMPDVCKTLIGRLEQVGGLKAPSRIIEQVVRHVRAFNKEAGIDEWTGIEKYKDGKALYNVVSGDRLKKMLDMRDANGKPLFGVTYGEVMKKAQEKIQAAADYVLKWSDDKRKYARNWEIEKRLADGSFDLGLKIGKKKLKVHFTGAARDDRPRFEYAGESAKIRVGMEKEVAAGKVSVGDLYAGDDILLMAYPDIALSPVVLAGPRGWDMGTVVLKGYNKDGSEVKVRNTRQRFEYNPQKNGKSQAAFCVLAQAK